MKSVDLATSFDAMRERFVSLSERTGANVLAATGSLEYALESKRWNNGVFSFAIMEGLGEQRADANDDGVVMLSELRAYVANRVRVLTDGGQQPTSRAKNIYFDFPVL